MTIDRNTLYITGAGVSAASGIPTYRTDGGIWVESSEHYTPQQMATRKMFHERPITFLKWVYKQHCLYKSAKPNSVHHWLADKNLITQNVDCLDEKAGNEDYIAIHGKTSKMSLYWSENKLPREALVQKDIPWHQVDEHRLEESLTEIFKIPSSMTPKKRVSYKPVLLLFDELYTELFRESRARQRIERAKKVVFLGTSFSVSFPSYALEDAIKNHKEIEIVDPLPLDLDKYEQSFTHHRMTAHEYIEKLSNR